MVMRVLAIALLLVMWGNTMVQAGERPLFAARGCERMSCTDAVPAQSSISGASLPYSPIPVADVLEANPCAGDEQAFVETGKIAACEIRVAGGKGTARQRAEDLFHLGHSYTFTDFEIVDGMSKGFRHAIETWDRAIGIDPGFVEPYVSKGLLIGAGPRPRDALPVLDEAIRIAPRYWWPRSAKAKVYWYARDYAAGEVEARLAAELAPDKQVPLQVMGSMLAASGRNAEAAEWFLKAGKLFDKGHMLVPGIMQEGNPWMSLAGTYGAEKLWGKADAAITHYLDSVSEAEWEPPFLIARAGYRENMGQHAAAAEDLDRAALKMGGREDVSGLRMRRARLLVAAGRLNEAEDEFRGLMVNADLQRILQLQVFLKNAGFEDLKINGQYDEITRQALASCLRETACISKHGQRL